MFDNYSLADLFANIYKNKKINSIILIAVFLLLAIPTTLKTMNSTRVVRTDASYSTYLIYRVDAPPSELEVDNYYGRYSDFYSKLIYSNINGAFLFNDVPEKEIEQIAQELSTNATQLKNSNLDFWSDKISTYSLVDNVGVTVKILTPSKTFNELIEGKLDKLMDHYKGVFDNVTVTKLDSVYSQEGTSSEKTISSFSKKTLIKQLVAIVLFDVFIILGANLVLYVFNPTINRAGDFNKYGIDFIYEITSAKDVKAVLDYKQQQIGTIALIASDAKLIEKFKKLLADNGVESPVTIIEHDDVETLLPIDHVVFVEEFGTTRYAKFEKKIQELKNLNKEVAGVVTFKL